MSPYKIGIISDTHNLLRPEILQHLAGCSAILHAGDVSRRELLDELQKIAPVYAVCGNNDKDLEKQLPETRQESLYGIRFFMIHNKAKLKGKIPDADIVVYGHSHRYEEAEKDGRVWLNPGSCGPRRFSLPVTMAVLEIGGPQEAEISGPQETEISAAQNVPDGYGQKCSVPAWKIHRIELQKGEKSTFSEKDMRKIVLTVTRDVDKGRRVEEIARRNGIDAGMTEQICRMYLTHPGVDVDGILNRMGLREKGL